MFEFLSASNLFFLGILLLFFAGIILYIEHKSKEQKHQLSSMFSLINSFNDELQVIKYDLNHVMKISLHQQETKPVSVPEPEPAKQESLKQEKKIPQSSLITVSDTEREEDFELKENDDGKEKDDDEVFLPPLKIKELNTDEYEEDKDEDENEDEDEDEDENEDEDHHQILKIFGASRPPSHGYENPFHSMLSSLFQGSAQFSVVMAASAELGGSEEEPSKDETNLIEELEEEEEEEGKKENKENKENKEKKEKEVDVASTLGEIGEEVDMDFDVVLKEEEKEEKEEKEEDKEISKPENSKKKNQTIRSVVLDSVSMDSSLGPLVDEEDSSSSFVNNNAKETTIKKQSIANLRKLAKEKQLANEETINKMKKNELIKILEEN
jgi:hypothetical protein